MTTNTTTPKTVTADELNAALKPFYELLGVDPFLIYSDAQPVIEIDDDLHCEVRFHKVVGRDLPREDWPIVSHGDEPGAELAYDVVIPVSGWPGDPRQMYGYGSGYPEGIAADGEDGRAILAEQPQVAESDGTVLTDGGPVDEEHGKESVSIAGPYAPGGYYVKTPMCPECAAGKHPNCAGTALTEDTDEIVACGCIDRSHASGTTP